LGEEDAASSEGRAAAVRDVFEAILDQEKAMKQASFMSLFISSRYKEFLSSRRSWPSMSA
jgi:hypothetical protein